MCARLRLTSQQVVPESKRHYDLDTNASYVIAGGLGGIGRSIIKWIVEVGARHLIVLSRSGLVTSAARSLIAEVEAMGVEIVAPRCDITDAAFLKKTLEELSERMPAIKGFIQAAMLLKVSGLLCQASASYIEV